MIKGKKAPEWNNSTAWEWIERRVQEALGTWAKWNPSTGGAGWTEKVIDKIKAWKDKFGLDKGLCANLEVTLQENCSCPTKK